MSLLSETFYGLHHQDDLFIMPNAWDAASARIIENCGAMAIATTSAGVAWSQGYPDGDLNVTCRASPLM